MTLKSEAKVAEIDKFSKMMKGIWYALLCYPRNSEN